MKRKLSVLMMAMCVFATILPLSAAEMTDAEVQQVAYEAGTAYNEGVTLYQSKDYAGAIEQFVVALDQYKSIDSPQHPQAERIQDLYKNLSVLYYLTKQYDEAINYYSIRLEADPSNAKIVNSLYKTYLKKGAESAAEQALLNYDNQYANYTVKYKLAQIYEKRGDLAKAISYYTGAFELNPKKVALLQKIAIFYHKTGEDAKAIKVYKDYIATNPPEYALRKVYKNLGIFYQNINDIPNAIDAFKSSLDLKFDKVVALTLVQFYYDTNSYAAARKLIAQVQAEDANNPQAYYYLGLMYVKEKNWDAATAEFNHILNDGTLGAAARKQIDYIEKNR